MRRNKCGVSPRAQKPVGSSHFGHCKWNTLDSVGRKCINGGGCHPRITCDQGTWIYQGWMKNSYLVLHEKTLCNCRERGFSLKKQTREKGIQAQWNIAASSVQLTAKVGKGAGGLWFDYSLGITAAVRPGCVYRAVVHSNLCIWHVDPVVGCPTYQRKEVERHE